MRYMQSQYRSLSDFTQQKTLTISYETKKKAPAGRILIYSKSLVFLHLLTIQEVALLGH